MPKDHKCKLISYTRNTKLQIRAPPVHLGNRIEIRGAMSTRNLEGAMPGGTMSNDPPEADFLKKCLVKTCFSFIFAIKKYTKVA